MTNVKNIFVVIAVVLSNHIIAQYDGLKGQGVYKKYDNTYINPDTRGKHSVSLGVMSSLNSQTPDFVPSWAVHFGYNYLIIKRRRRLLGIKETFRDETKNGFGLHFTLLKEGEFYLMANYYDPIIALRTKVLSFYFFNEYGIGFHRYTDIDDLNSRTSLNLSLEIFRIRFGKTPLNLHLTANYAASNNFLGKERLNMGALAGLRYYIFKKK
jgi:hypothetical protein